MPGISFLDRPEIEWGDIKLRVVGARLKKMTKISFGSEIEKELLYAEGNDPFGVQNGNRSYSGELGMLVVALLDMNKAAILANGKDILDLEGLTITVQLKSAAHAAQTCKPPRVQLYEI